MERIMTDPARRRRIWATVALLGLVAAGLYGGILLRFSAFMGNGG